MKNQKHWRKL